MQQANGSTPLCSILPLKSTSCKYNSNATINDNYDDVPPDLMWAVPLIENTKTPEFKRWASINRALGLQGFKEWEQQQVEAARSAKKAKFRLIQTAKENDRQAD